MTNEELVLLIKNGDRAYYAELWEQVRLYVKARAKFFYKNGVNFIRCEIDDLIQAGYLAMVDAVETYDPERASFITHFTFYLRTAFIDTAIGCTAKKRNDPLFSALDLYGDVYGDGGTTLEEITPGCAPDPEERSLDAVYNMELRAALYAVMDRNLTPREKDILQRHFMQGQTIKACAEIHGISQQAAAAAQQSALRKMRRNNRELKSYVDNLTPYYLGIGAKNYHNKGYSPVERLAELRERLEKMYMNRFTDN